MAKTYVDIHGKEHQVDTSEEACACFHDGEKRAKPRQRITGPEGTGIVVGAGVMEDQKVLFIALDDKQGNDTDVVTVSYDFQCFTDCTDLEERGFSLED